MILNNLLLGVNMTAVAEAMVLGVKAGIDPDTLFEIISKSGNWFDPDLVDKIIKKIIGYQK